MNALRQFGRKISAESINRFGTKAGMAIRRFGQKAEHVAGAVSRIAQRALPVAEAIADVVPGGAAFAPLLSATRKGLGRLNDFKTGLGKINNMIQAP